MSGDEEEHTTTTTHSNEDNVTSVQGRFYLGRIAFSVYTELAAQLRQRGWSRTHSVTHCDLLLGDRFHIPYSTIRCEAPLPSSSIFHGVRWVHYFKGSHILTLKASMARLLQANTNACPPWLPLTFVLGGDQSKRVDDRNALCNVATQEERGDALWIVKPSSGAKGEGIVLLRGAHDIKAFVDSLDDESRAIYVVQRYIERPLLLSHGRKFDIRFWVLLMSPYTIYVFSQASCRTASAAFDPSDLTNTAAHLTNHCVQEGVVGFGQYESGNEMWLDALRDYLLTCSGFTSDNIMERVVLLQAKAIIVETLLAIRPELELLGDEPYSCFQLFGYDMMLDDQLRMNLLEINGSPGVANKYLSVLTSRVIDLLYDAEGNIEKAARVWDITKEEFVLLWSPSDTTKDD